MSNRAETVLTDAVNAFFKPTITDEGTELIVQSLLEALKANRIALIELPEVDRGWSTRNAWTVDESYVVAETDVGVVLEDGDTVAAMRVETATRLAAALLAAAAEVTE